MVADWGKSDKEISEYLTGLGQGFVDDSRIKELCRHAYSSEALSQQACSALTRYIDRRNRFPVGYLTEIATFLEAHDYLSARQALIQNRNALQPVIDQGDVGLMVVSSDAKKAWSAVCQAVEHLRVISLSKASGGAVEINITGSVGILSTGDMATIESVSVRVSSLQQAGHTDLAAALKAVSEAVLATGEIAASQRSEILEQLEELGRQASLSPGNQMKPSVLKSLIGGISGTIGTAGAAASVWATWGGTISKFFGI